MLPGFAGEYTEHLCMFQVKARNKKLCAAAEEAKEATTKCKYDLEGAYTALQNLLYEKVSMIDTCHARDTVHGWHLWVATTSACMIVVCTTVTE